jgi:hypothetical protein
MGSETLSIVPAERITSIIYYIRGEKVLLDFDLAELYNVNTSQLKRTVRRNIKRFPLDFMFQLTKEEMEILRCQIGTSNWGGRRYLPFAFTEQGIAMLSSVLNSERAVLVNIAIMRAFVQMRKFIMSNNDLAKKLNALENKVKNRFAKQQKQINIIFDAIKELMIEKEAPKRKIGF